MALLTDAFAKITCNIIWVCISKLQWTIRYELARFCKCFLLLTRARILLIYSQHKALYCSKLTLLGSYNTHFFFCTRKYINIYPNLVIVFYAYLHLLIKYCILKEYWRILFRLCRVRNVISHIIYDNSIINQYQRLSYGLYYVNVNWSEYGVSITLQFWNK